MLSDIEIAQAAKMKPITEIAAQLGLQGEDVIPYGHYKAKINQKQQQIYLLDKKINAQKQKLKELEQNLYVNAQGENFRSMRPIFEDER